MKLSVEILPLVLIESNKNVRIIFKTGLLVAFPVPVHPIHSGRGSLNINSRKGISIPTDTIENTTDRMINRK